MKEIDLFVLPKILPKTIICCENRSLLLAALPFIDPNTKVLWLPHGLSDKGLQRPYFELLKTESLLLIYGQLIKERLIAKNIHIPTLYIGNFRAEYFYKHRSFYEAQLDLHFGKSRYFFYAPSWDDGESSGMFWEVYPELIRTLPPHIQMLIKLHPNTEIQEGIRVEKARAAAPNNIRFVEQFPPIYPLLSRADAYLGDRSSIGYDFLHFRKPLVFTIRKQKMLFSGGDHSLLNCGNTVFPNEIGTIFSEKFSCRADRIDAMLKIAFCASVNWKQEIWQWI